MYTLPVEYIVQLFTSIFFHTSLIFLRVVHHHGEDPVRDPVLHPEVVQDREDVPDGDLLVTQPEDAVEIGLREDALGILKEPLRFQQFNEQIPDGTFKITSVTNSAWKNVIEHVRTECHINVTFFS